MQFKINGIVPGSLPPTLTNIYCSNANSNIQVRLFTHAVLAVPN